MILAREKRLPLRGPQTLEPIFLRVACPSLLLHSPYSSRPHLSALWNCYEGGEAIEAYLTYLERCLPFLLATIYIAHYAHALSSRQSTDDAREL